MGRKKKGGQPKGSTGPAESGEQSQQVQQTAHQSQPTAESVQPTAGPSQPRTDSAHPAEQPSQAKPKPIQPAAEPPHPRADPTQPTEGPRKKRTSDRAAPKHLPEPSQSRAEPSLPPAEPSQARPKPAQSPAEPSLPRPKAPRSATEPLQPRPKPAQPATEPSQPTTEPALPTAKRSQQRQKPAQPPAEPSQPRPKAAHPATEPPQPRTEPTLPTAERSQKPSQGPSKTRTPAITTSQPAVGPPKLQPEALRQRDQKTTGYHRTESSTAGTVFPQPQAIGSPQSQASVPKRSSSHSSVTAPSEARESTVDVGALKEHLPSISTKNGWRPIPRPDRGGTVGRKIELLTNFFKMKIDENVTIQHYDVAITPEIKTKSKVREIVRTFITASPEVFRNVFPVFDGMKNLYTHCELPINNSVFEKAVQCEGDREGAKPIKVAIKHVASIPLYELVEFINGRVRDCPQNAFQAIDIVLREFPTQRYIPLSKYIFTHQTPGVNCGAGLELWGGYFQSFRPGWKVPLLNVDSTVRVFHKGQRVMDLLEEVLQGSYDYKKFEEHIKGLAVEIDVDAYPMLSRRTYKIIGLSQDACNRQRFPMSQPDGSERPCIVAEYFRTQYNINLRYSNLPCLQAQPREKHRYIPMELCIVKKGQQLRSVGDKLKAELIRYSAVPANVRKEKINSTMTKFQPGADVYCKAYGLSVNSSMLEVPGRVLTPPTITYKESRDIRVREGSWNMRDVQFFSGAVADVVGAMCFDVRSEDEAVLDFIDGLCGAARSVGMHLTPPKKVHRGRKVDDVARILKAMYKETDQRLQLVIAILPGFKNNDIYGEIKRVGDLELGVATQCIQSTKGMRPNPQTYANICQKINAKLGKTNAIIKRIELSKIFKDPVIIMGADVTHPAPGDTTKPSIAAVTGSYDANAYMYAARTSMQQHREEMITDLKNITVDLLKNFRQHTNYAPKRIIFYRDGVSEGQFTQVLGCELQAIQQACVSLNVNYKPHITYIVVQKRHHARFFCKNRGDEVGRSGNIPAGTTVDTVVIHPVEFDFYLCSHQGIQGTSKPAHYYVLYDDSNFNSDIIQELSYQLCHVYARCTRSVSIPAPVYYAHLCAFRGRYYFDRLMQSLQVPQGGITEPTALKDLNTACLINRNYNGMFFV